MIKNMTREDYMELFDLTDDDIGMENADEQHLEGFSWFEIAKDDIATMNTLLMHVTPFGN